MTTPAQTSSIENLISALNLSNYPQEEQERIILELSDTLFRGTLVRLIERMDDATRTDLNTLMEGDVDSEKVVAFLKERVSGADEVVREVLHEITNNMTQLPIKESAS